MKKTEKARTRIQAYLTTHGEARLDEIIPALKGTSPERIRLALSDMVADGSLIKPDHAGGKYIWMGRNSVEMPMEIPRREYTKEQRARIPTGVIYDDWNGVLDRLKKMYLGGVQSLLIGPAGTGKTACVMKLAQDFGIPLYSVNFSLRTREHHFIGRLSLQNGGTDRISRDVFKPGTLIESMECGGIFYGDEISCSEPDILLRLDEALDFRHQVNIEGTTYKAEKGWFAVATINPLSHVGTKELPPQILSRFGARFKFDYPPLKTEMRIVQMHVGRIPTNLEYQAELILKTIHAFRAPTTDLPYKPSIRESIASVRMLVQGFSAKEALEMALINTYAQFSDVAELSARNLMDSEIRGKGA